MKKRTVSILMTAILAAGVLAGCGSASSGAAGSASTDETAPAQETTAAGSTVQMDASADGTAESSAAQITVQPNGDDHLAKILAAGKITVATEGEWSPFTYHDADTNELVGFDVEAAKEIASRLGVEAEFKEGDFDGGLTGVSQGTFDMMANGVDVTPDREQTFDFTDPYAYDHAVLVTKSDNEAIKTFDDLKGKTTANSVGSTYAAMGEQYGATVVNVPTLGETMELVLNGTADATINANTSVQDYFNTTGEKGLKVAATDPETTSYAIPLTRSGRQSTRRSQRCGRTALSRRFPRSILAQTSRRNKEQGRS